MKKENVKEREVTSTAVTEKSSETTTKPKAEVENVTETSKEVAFPTQQKN